MNARLRTTLLGMLVLVTGLVVWILLGYGAMSLFLYLGWVSATVWPIQNLCIGMSAVLGLAVFCLISWIVGKDLHL